MGEADRRTISAGTPEAVLVERAGRAVARHALRLLGGTYGRRVVVICGRGNNGADGAVAARHLAARGVGGDEFVLTGGVAEPALRRALGRCDLAIDAMFGTGFHGALEGDAAIVARALAEAGLPTLAIDIPSGVDGTTGEVRGDAVRAQETVCFAALKPGLLFEPGRAHAGRVHVVDVGVDVGKPQLHVVDVSDLYLPKRAFVGHKWSAGVLIVGGSTGMAGASTLAGRAAARCGAGMVVCGVPGADAAARAGGSELVTRALPATPDGSLDADAADEVLADIERFRAVAIGPGLGRDARTQIAVRRLVAGCPVPIVVDADPLNALAAEPQILSGRRPAGLAPPILTPHAREYAPPAGQ